MKILMVMVIASVLIFNTVQAQANGQQCYPEKILSSSTKIGILKSYFIEEVQDIPSEVIFYIQGRELRLIADFQKKGGKKISHHLRTRVWLDWRWL